MATPQNPMEYIWERVPKQKDGKTIRYIKGDLEYLYIHGFVDTKKCTLEEWKQAFEPYKQQDESYVLNHDQFLTLRIYRYNGPSDEVFNSAKIQEGPWSDKELQFLYDRSIGVASNVSHEMFWAYINSLKKTGHYTDKNGLFMMNLAVKVGLDALVKQYPSPRTLLELEVRRIRIEKEKRMRGHLKNRDASAFSVGQTESENKMAAFQKMQSASKATIDSAKTEEKDSSKETLDIKSLRKPTKNFRG